MTKLIVRPLVWDEPGSFRARSRALRLFQLARDGQKNNDQDAVASAYIAIEDLLIPRLATDDGTPVDEVLDELSAEQFDELIGGLMGQETVPPANAPSSTAGGAGTQKKRRNG